jgi:predicted transcriptional regulator of viral defense system
MVLPGLPETFTFAEAAQHGLSRRELARLRDGGEVEQIARGIYRRADQEPADYDLLEIAIRAHQPTLCLLSALARHELTDIIPPAHDIAIPRGAWRPAVSAPVHWHKFSPETFEVGRGVLLIDQSHSIGLYDAARCIIDAYRLPGGVGPDIANEALRRWLRRGGRPPELIHLTNTFPAARPPLLHALQVLQ